MDNAASRLGIVGPSREVQWLHRLHAHPELVAGLDRLHVYFTVFIT